MDNPNPNEVLPQHGFQDLAEEIILNIFPHMKGADLLAFALTSRTMNRLAIEHLLCERGISKPGTHCKLMLEPEPQSTTDSLKVVLHSVHLKAFNHLCLCFTRFSSYSALLPAFHRTLRLLRNATELGEVALYFGSKGINEPKDERHFKDMVVALQDIFNEISIKSCHKLRVFDSEGLLGQFYEFRKSGAASGSKLITGVKDYLNRRQEKGSGDDPVATDDLRYSRTSAMGFRIFLRCSPKALEKAQLNHFNFGTVDVLRPPFSQWTFPMLKASNIQSFSVGFSRFPKDLEELDFILQRLASTLPQAHRLYLYDITSSVLPSIIKWIGMFPSLQVLQLKPGSYDRDFGTLPNILHSSYSSDTSGPSQLTFASTLRRVDASYRFMSYMFSGHGSSEGGDGARVTFSSLQKVHLDYFCVDWVGLDLSVLATTLRHIKTSLVNPNTLSSVLIVHFRFDRFFRGITKSMCEGTIGPDDLTAEDAAVLAEVEKVRVGLPGSRRAIEDGEFDAKVLGCLTPFPGLKHLTLLSEYSSIPKEKIGFQHFQVFSERMKGLERVYLGYSN